MRGRRSLCGPAKRTERTAVTGMTGRAFGPLPPVSLEDLVPPDHVSRHLERSRDLALLRDLGRDDGDGRDRRGAAGALRRVERRGAAGPLTPEVLEGPRPFHFQPRLVLLAETERARG